jgi:8'-apo-carotenoid 13,14-cleaving dioxygenase
MDTATTLASADSTGELYVTKNRAPITEEVTAFDLEVIGRIPEALNGRFTRMGPNPIGKFDAARLKAHHWFSGSGMAHGLRLQDGKAEWFRSRRVVDRIVAAARGVKPIPGPGEGERDGPVNTNIVMIGGKLYAAIEAGNLPVELSYELESVRRSDFDGGLEAGFSAHTKEDPATGEQHVLTYGAGEPVRYVSISREGRATTKARIDLPHFPMIHDTAFTNDFIVVPDFPVTFQPHNSHTDFPWLWDESRPSRIGLMPRNGDASRIQWFESPRCFAFHFVNAFEEGDLTIVDLPKHPSMFRTDQNGPNEGAPILVRWTLNRATGRLTETVLDDHGCDFPRMNDALSGRAYRYAYTAHWGDKLRLGPSFKHDVQRGVTETHDYGPGCMTSEPVFVAKPDAKAEDEGWVISSVYDSERDLSDIVILDAQDFTGDPVATIRLPTRIPYTYHGGWAPD